MATYHTLICLCLVGLSLAGDQKFKKDDVSDESKQTDLEGADSHSYDYPHKGYYADNYGYPYGLHYGKYGHDYGKFYVPTYNYGKKFDGYYPYYGPGYYGPYKGGYYPWKGGSHYPYNGYPPYGYGGKHLYPPAHGYYY